MAIDWSLGRQPNIIGNALQAFQSGRQEREQVDQRNALLDIRKQESQQRQAEFASQQQDRAAKEKERGQQQIGLLAKLVDHAKDEATYQESLSAAKQYGLDVSQAPPTFGDGSWVRQQRLLIDLHEKDGGEHISGIARELQDAGYKPGTPEFADAMRSVIGNKYSSVSADESGAQFRDPLKLPGQAPAVADDDEWEVVRPGGGGGDAPGGFPR